MSIVNNSAVAQDYKLLFTSGQIICIGTKSVQNTRIEAHIFPGQERRKNVQSVIFSVKIPFLSRSKMVHQAVIVFLHNHADVLHTAIDHA